MEQLCDEDAAKFMSESLLDHARRIYRYAKTYSQPIHPDKVAEKKLKDVFFNNVERMIKEMYGLMYMARKRGIARFCNNEQIEAYMAEARALVSRPAYVSQASSLYN
jgi:hypothetical protein